MSASEPTHSDRLKQAWKDGKYRTRHYVRRWDAWTKAMDLFLSQNHATMDLAELAIALYDEFDIPRTQRAVETRLASLNLIAYNKTLTASQVAYYLGIDSVTAAIWIKNGYILGEQRKPGAKRSVWQVRHDNLSQFVLTHREMCDINRMPKSRWKRELELHQQRDPIYPLKEVAISLGVSPQMLREQIGFGRLEAVPHMGQKGRVVKWFVRRSQLDQYLVSS